MGLGKDRTSLKRLNGQWSIFNDQFTMKSFDTYIVFIDHYELLSFYK